MKDNTIKLLIAILLCIIWAVMIYFPPKDPAQAVEIISEVKYALGGLFVWHAGSRPKDGDNV